MKNIKNTGFILISILFLFITVFAAQAQTLPIDIDRVEIDDVEIYEDHENRLDLLHNQKVMIEVTLTAYENIRDVELEAFISGFEFSDIYPLTATTHVFDADAGVTYVKRLNIEFPDLVEEDDYRLRIMVTDRNNDEYILNYNLKLDVPRHRLKIEDIIFFPGRNVMAGQALLTTVRLENKGERDEDDIRVNVIIPELGLAASDYINEIESTEEEETEEIFMRIPVCAEQGQYDVIIEAIFDEGFEKIVTSQKLDVLANSRCEENQEETTLIVAPEEPEQITPIFEEQVEEKKTSKWSALRDTLEVIFLTLVILLVIVGLIIAFAKRKASY